jgi:hypothetical protein
MRALLRLDVLQHRDEVTTDLSARARLFGRSIGQARDALRQPSRRREMAALRIDAFARRIVEQ